MPNNNFKVESAIEMRDSDGSSLVLHHDGQLQKTDTAGNIIDSKVASEKDVVALAIALG